MHHELNYSSSSFAVGHFSTYLDDMPGADFKIPFSLCGPGSVPHLAPLCGMIFSLVTSAVP